MVADVLTEDEFDQACRCLEQKQAVLDLIDQYGTIDGAHHKQWLIDQIVRELTGEDYDQWVEEYSDVDDPDYFAPEEWSTGIAP